MKTATIKIVFDFDGEMDISYVKLAHNLSDVEELKNAIEIADGKCCENIFENDNCIYACEGHCVETLCNYLKEYYGFESEIIAGFTVTNEKCIVAEPNYDFEMRLW